MKDMSNRAPFVILFVLGLLSGVLLYWLASISLNLRAESYEPSLRVIASSSPVSDCRQIKQIKDKKDIDIYCSFSARKQDRGVSYRVRSTVKIKTDKKNNQAVISVFSRIRDKTAHLTEADYCGDCTEQRTVDLSDLDNLDALSEIIQSRVNSAVQESTDKVETAVDEAYKRHIEKQKLKARIARCEISPKSTIDDIETIQPDEKIKCRKEQMADIANGRKRTQFFHSTVKKDLWYLAQQDKPLNRDFFLSDYMQELNNPDFFNHDYFSVRSAIDTMAKYNDMRLFMDEIGDNKTKALNSLSAQLPYYFHTDNTSYGREDRRHLEVAWNKNFPEKPFPAYYSLTEGPSKELAGGKRTGMSAQQFRNIVNSPDFQKLYQP